jgi:phosphate transport system protein
MPSQTTDHQHIVSAFDRELTELRRLVVDMGEAVARQTRDAVTALLTTDPAGAQAVIDREPDIDAMSVEADEEVFRVIAKRQPTAVDLRLVLAVSRVVGELERGGDKAERIANNILKLTGSDQAKHVSEVLTGPMRALEQVVIERLGNAVRGIVDANMQLAIDVFESESTLREARTALTETLVAPSTPFSGTELAALLTIEHALERIGNHAGNIAEQVVYVITAEDVRYRNRSLLIDALKHRDATAAPNR